MDSATESTGESATDASNSIRMHTKIDLGESLVGKDPNQYIWELEDQLFEMMGDFARDQIATVLDKYLYRELRILLNDQIYEALKNEIG